MKLRFRIRDLFTVILAAATLLVLWRLATIDHDTPPTILAGPIWFIKFFVPVALLGSQPVVHIFVGSIITMALVAGIFGVIFRPNVWTGLLSISSLLVWFWCGIIMRHVIIATLGV